MKTIYWRRVHQFPAAGMNEVRVVRAEHWDAPPLDRDETHDLGWHRLDIDTDGGAEVVTDIWGPLGLCGDLTDPVAIADGVAVAAAVMAELGVRPPMPEDAVYDCPWKPSDLVGCGADDQPSPAYEALQCHCANVYEHLREALAEKHGIEISPLAAS
jgi:hypothetical protein